MNSKSLSISKRELLYLISFFFFLQPRWFYYIPFVNRVFRYTNILLCGLLLLIYVADHHNSKIVNLTLIYHIYLTVVTILRKGDIGTAIIDSALFIGLTILTDLVIRTKPAFLYTKLMYLLDLEVIINLLTIILKPEGLYSTTYFRSNYFLGYDNQMINILIPTLLLAFLYYETGYRRSGLHLFIISSTVIASVVLVWSGASLVIMAIVFGLLMFKLKDNTRIFNMRNYLLVNVNLFFILVVFRLQELFEYLIVVVLQKNLTLSGRIYTWSRAIYFILKKPVFGYGIEDQTYRASKMALRQYFAVSARSSIFPGLHAHNRFLETAYRGGIILTIIYVVMLVIVVKNLMKNKELNSAKILAVFLFAYLTGMLTEFYRLSYMFFPMMVMAERIEIIENSINVYGQFYHTSRTRIRLRRRRV